MITTLTVIAALAAGQAAEPASTEPPPASPGEEGREGGSTGLLRGGGAGAARAVPAGRRGGAHARLGRRPAAASTAARSTTARSATRRSGAASPRRTPSWTPTASRWRSSSAPPPAQGPALTLLDLTSRGYSVLPALAEAPPGWYRDERQRVMQVDFDLNARYFLGGGWACASGGAWSGNGVVSGGGRLDRPFTWWSAPALARMHFLEGWVSADGNNGELLVFGIDASRVYPTPLLRITTFFGKPRRFDPPLYFGLWAEAVRMEMLETEAGTNFDRTMMVSGAATVDVWRSRDLSDFLRVRVGAGYEEAMGGDWGSTVPHAALEGEVTLGAMGKHHVRGSAQAELLTGSGELARPGDAPRQPLAASR